MRISADGSLPRAVTREGPDPGHHRRDWRQRRGGAALSSTQAPPFAKAVDGATDDDGVPALSIEAGAKARNHCAGRDRHVRVHCRPTPTRPVAPGWDASVAYARGLYQRSGPRPARSRRPRFDAALVGPMMSRGERARSTRRRSPGRFPDPSCGSLTHRGAPPIEQAVRATWRDCARACGSTRSKSTAFSSAPARTAGSNRSSEDCRARPRGKALQGAGNCLPRLPRFGEKKTCGRPRGLDRIFHRGGARMARFGLLDVHEGSTAMC